LEQQGGIDLLVNNAGVGDGGAFHEYSLENWDWMIGINQMGVLYGCHYFVPVMQKQKGGQIINIASAAGFANAPRMSPYNVTKAAVISLSESLYYELDPLGIGVSVVMPTFIRTDIMQFARGTDDAVRRGRKFLEKTKLGPNDAVLEMLTKAGKGKLHIVLPKEARQSHWMKRIFPRFFRKQLMKISKRQLAKKP
ncbi:MAG: SDR family NAD(P)-dependent oxidoreductase, partial [Saprospiraceae bacterium]